MHWRLIKYTIAAGFMFKFNRMNLLDGLLLLMHTCWTEALLTIIGPGFPGGYECASSYPFIQNTAQVWQYSAYVSLSTTVRLQRIRVRL